MNRKAFLQQSSLAVAAVAGLPRAIRGTQQNYPHIYQSTLIDQKKGSLQYILTVYHSSIQLPSYASEEEKAIYLKIKYYEGDMNTPEREAELKYIMTGAKQTDAGTDTWTVTARFDSKVSGDYQPPKSFFKSLTLRIRLLNSADIMASKKKSLVTLPYYSVYTPSSGSGGCFLTTACVEHRLLPDDCEELTTLRNLRDQYMLQSAEGQDLVRQYYQGGPAIVAAINSCDNRNEIYDYMHREMILPSVQLVKEGKLEEAAQHYSVFVTALQQQYCQ